MAFMRCKGCNSVLDPAKVKVNGIGRYCSKYCMIFHIKETYCDKFYYQNILTKEIISLPSPNMQNLPKGKWMYIGKNDEVKLKVEDYEKDGWNMKIKKECD